MHRNVTYPRLERPAWSSAVLLAGLLAFMPFVWLTLASLGGFRLKIAHVCLALLGANVVLQLAASANSFRIRRSPLLAFSLSYAGYLVFLLLATSVSRYPGAEPAQLIKHLVYFAGFLVIYLAVARNQRSLSQLSVGVTIGSLLSIALFSLSAIFVFAGLRRNFFGECYELLLSGKAAKLQFGIYPVLFSNSVFSAERATMDAEFTHVAAEHAGWRVHLLNSADMDLSASCRARSWTRSR